MFKVGQKVFVCSYGNPRYVTISAVVKDSYLVMDSDGIVSSAFDGRIWKDEISYYKWMIRRSGDDITQMAKNIGEYEAKIRDLRKKARHG